jgi:hypothetical protein
MLVSDIYRLCVCRASRQRTLSGLQRTPVFATYSNLVPVPLCRLLLACLRPAQCRPCKCTCALQAVTALSNSTKVSILCKAALKTMIECWAVLLSHSLDSQTAAATLQGHQ